MKYILVLLLFAAPIVVSAQTKDTLLKGQEQLLRLVGGFIKTQMTGAMKENGTANGMKSLIGNGVKEVLKNTVKRSATSLLGNGLNFGNALQLPSILQNNKEALLQKGKSELLNNFHQSLKDAAANALEASIPMFVLQAAEFNVDDLVKYANADSLSLTDIFKNAHKNALIKIASPLAKSTLKLSGANKKYKKIRKAFNKLGGEKLDLDNEHFLSEEIVNHFLGEMKVQEQLLKQNPSSLLDKLKGLINFDN
jgi:hypothetical protein